MAGGGLY
ncbi:hypothetical protein YPPY36_2329, partial [Yersinia pestis PY-36]